MKAGPSICGSKAGAHFGTAILYLQDLDLDGYGGKASQQVASFPSKTFIPDVAIGSPYEDDGRGTVYIYNGSPTGLIPEPSQTIHAGSIYKDLRSFGYSLSNPADIDANGYKGMCPIIYSLK